MRLANVPLLLSALMFAAVIVACGGGGKGSKTATVIVTKQATTAATTVAATPTVEEILPTATSEAIPPVTGQPTVTSSGLQIYDIQVGSGTEAKAGSIIQIKYSEWLSTGQKIADTILEPIQERLTPGHVIQGWLEGIPGMKEGGTRRLIVPFALTQGEPGIPSGTSVTYDIELVAVVQQ